MKDKLKSSWRKTPTRIRQPLVLIVGLLFILAAGMIGWLPGPGGIPLFLIGIAILATEFAWAHRIKVLILDTIHAIGRWYRSHRVLGTIGLILLVSTSMTLAYFAFVSLQK